MRRVVIFNYSSKFAGDILRVLSQYNYSNPENSFKVDFYHFDKYESESEVGAADVIIHSGGDGRPVCEDITGVPKVYICHSHEWKALACGAEMVQLSSCIKGRHEIDVIEDDEILGPRKKIPIMKYHELAIVTRPKKSRILAVSRALDANNKEIEIIEALRYDDGSIGIQGHPEEGAAAHIFHNFLNFVPFKNRRSTCPRPKAQPVPAPKLNLPPSTFHQV
jgi:anthranilate/para-aminobenzoate synthase component II